ncbi:PspC domain-containing protein [Streptomyces sp. MP131-18]|uniref:PspC domain-containing protein n=1 Tax=Streptomyces sp. MP131-18 TaxID=1857892 RepID=UPI001568759A|nr:PspC domain-containing protein [Streptomyces sp. MP131-18]
MTDDLTTEPPPGTAAATRLSRSRRHKVVGGVCGGFGRYYNLDPVIFRVPLAVLSVIGGLGLVAYGIAWLLIPFEREEENEGRRLLSGRVEGPGLTALLFIVAGCGLLLASLGNRGPATWFSVMLLGALAGAAYWSRRRSESQGAGEGGEQGNAATAQVVAEAPPEAQAPPAPLGPSWWQGGGAGWRRAYLWGPEEAEPGDYAPTAPPVAGAPPGAAPSCQGRPARRPAEPRELRLGGLLFLLAAGACLVGSAVAWEHQPLGTTLVIGLSAALIVYGVGFVVSAFVGRLGGGTVVAVILTGALLAGAAVLPDNITTSWVGTQWRPESAAAVTERYELGSGDAELDLTGFELDKGETLSTTVAAGAGQIRVLVPRGAEVTVHTEIGVGAFTYESPASGTWEGLEDSWGGLGQERTRSYPAEPGAEPGGDVELWLDMGIGHVAVERS